MIKKLYYLNKNKTKKRKKEGRRRRKGIKTMKKQNKNLTYKKLQIMAFFETKLFNLFIKLFKHFLEYDSDAIIIRNDKKDKNLDIISAETGELLITLNAIK